MQGVTGEERFAEAKALFDNGDYLEARQQFELIRVQYPGTAVSAEAQYYLAECHYMRGEYLLAAYEFNEFLRFYLSNQKAPDARFKVAMSNYSQSPDWSLDQKNTLLAIEAFQTFIEYYPTHRLVPEAEGKIKELKNKLAKKQYETGILYMKMEDYKAALTYFDELLDKYYDSDYAGLAQLKKVEVQIARKRYGEAKFELDKFLVKYPDSTLKDDAEKMRSEIESKIGR
jgi:outer membrane protein assembly factor BamD